MSSNRTPTISEFATLFAFIGPAGAGKSVLVNFLCESSSEFHLVVSATTRSPRPRELNGVHYHFLSRDAFKEKVDRNEFFEWEEVHGQYYGTPWSELSRAQGARSKLLFDIDIRGAQSLAKSFPGQLVCVAVLPPNRSVLVDRLRSRGSNDEDIKKRLMTAETEYALMRSPELKTLVDFVVINDDLTEAKTEVQSIVRAESLRPKRIVKEKLDKLLTI